MIYKSYLIEQNLEAINKNKIFLFYGENEGLKEDFKKNIKLINKSKEIISLLSDDVIKNEDLLINEILNK